MELFVLFSTLLSQQQSLSLLRTYPLPLHQNMIRVYRMTASFYYTSMGSCSGSVTQKYHIANRPSHNRREPGWPDAVPPIKFFSRSTNIHSATEWRLPPDRFDSSRTRSVKILDPRLLGVAWPPAAAVEAVSGVQKTSRVWESTASSSMERE